MFLTSSPYEGDHFSEANGFVRNLRQALPAACRVAFVCSSPDDPERTDFFAESTLDALKMTGISVSGWTVLDRRNQDDAAAVIRDADFVILAGGHVPTQNKFFMEIGLREILRGFDGVVMGISAGSMNAARVVYAQPELSGEATDPDYRRFLPGLGLTETMILPHLNLIREDVLDGQRLFEDIAFPDSMGRRFFAIPDGSYFLIRDGVETLHGDGWVIADGKMEKVGGKTHPSAARDGKR